MSKQRITIETLRSGQPRAYADSESVVRVTFESTDWLGRSDELQPEYLAKDLVHQRLLRLQCGFIETSKADAGFLGSYLDYLRPVDPRPASDFIKTSPPDLQVASVWEFRIVQPFTD